MFGILSIAIAALLALQFATAPRPADNSDFYCVDSLAFMSTSEVEGYAAAVNVLVEGEISNYEINVQNSSSPSIFNIAPTQRGTTILMRINFTGPSKNDIYLIEAFNRPAGDGISFYDSRGRVNRVFNGCRNICRYQLSRLSSNWAVGLKVGILVKNRPKGVYEGGDAIEFEVSKDDDIRVAYEYTEPADLGYDYAIQIQDVSSKGRSKPAFYIWYIGSYDYPTLIETPCSKSFPESPFGGRMLYISEERTNKFSEKNTLASPVLPLTNDLEN